MLLVFVWPVTLLFDNPQLPQRAFSKSVGNASQSTVVPLLSLRQVFSTIRIQELLHAWEQWSPRSPHAAVHTGVPWTPPGPHLSDVLLRPAVRGVHDSAHNLGVSAHNQRFVWGICVNSHATMVGYCLWNLASLPQHIAVSLKLPWVRCLEGNFLL